MRDRDHDRHARGAIGRRGLLLGGGTLASLVASGVQPAPAGTASRSSAIRPAASPVESTIAGAPADGYAYRTFAHFDFFSEDTPGRSFGSEGGVYPTTGNTTMWATCDIPPGALVRDVEWYVYNNSGSVWDVGAYLWTAGSASVATLVETTQPSAGKIVVTRARVPPESAGPYPAGTKLAIGIHSTGSAVQINGARVGFQKGGAGIGLRPAPVRLFDSATGGVKLAANQTHVVTIPSLYLPSGTTGAILTVTATGAAGAGYLKVYGFQSAPANANVSYPQSATATDEVTVAIAADRKVKIFTSRTTHVAIDLVGTIA